DKAFTRLQEEIIRVSGDQTIFAHDQENTILATSPRYFRDGVSIVKAHDKRYMSTDSFTITQKGLRIQMPLLNLAHRLYLGILECRYRDDIRGPIGLPLQKTLNSANNDGKLPVFHRVGSIRVAEFESNPRLQAIYITSEPSST